MLQVELQAGGSSRTQRKIVIFAWRSPIASFDQIRSDLREATGSALVGRSVYDCWKQLDCGACKFTWVFANKFKLDQCLLAVANAFIRRDSRRETFNARNRS